MCGIAGVIGVSSNQSIGQMIAKMTKKLQHRGPDAEGFFYTKKIALGHRRLSIIDLSDSANQPLTDNSKRYTIVFNGEIYNFQTIKKQLLAYNFNTESDTEVVLAAYITWGKQCLEHFNGMFALAIWDSEKEELFVARDRMGIKPFYYYQNAECFIFASEMRAILASELVPRQLNKSGLETYLKYQTVHAPNTIIQNVFQLQSGNYGCFKKGTFTVHKYWNIKDYFKQTQYIDPAKAKLKTKELFIQAVENRLVSDVPVGAFLSGGIDSSAVVSVMAELSNQAIDTFSIGFKEKAFDESPFAQLIAKKYQTRHHQLMLSSQELLKKIPSILSTLDVPSTDGANSYVVAEMTCQANIKVALSGLGGDELFAGYSTFQRFEQLKKRHFFWKTPLVFRQAGSAVIQQFATTNAQLKISNLLEQKSFSMAEIYPIFRQLFSKKEINKLLKTNRNNLDVMQQLLMNQVDKNIISAISIAEISTYTQDVLLRDTDVMSMAHGLEVRVPFFDHHLVEYVLQLPSDIKRPTYSKSFLVESLAPRLPKEIVFRERKGFTFPWKEWMLGALAPINLQQIKWLSELPIFNKTELLTYYQRFLKGDKRVSWSKIWSLITLSAWMQQNEIYC